MSTIHYNFTKRQTPLSKNITRINPSSDEKFVPTCEICGKKHWPLDPSCIGKKGVKAEAREKVKAAREAKAEAKLKAKAEENIAKLKSEFAANQKSYKEHIAKIKADAEEALAKEKA